MKIFLLGVIATLGFNFDAHFDWLLSPLSEWKSQSAAVLPLQPRAVINRLSKDPSLMHSANGIFIGGANSEIKFSLPQTKVRLIKDWQSGAVLFASTLRDFGDWQERVHAGISYDRISILASLIKSSDCVIIDPPTSRKPCVDNLHFNNNIQGRTFAVIYGTKPHINLFLVRIFDGFHGHFMDKQLYPRPRLGSQKLTCIILRALRSFERTSQITNRNYGDNSGGPSTPSGERRSRVYEAQEPVPYSPPLYWAPIFFGVFGAASFGLFRLGFWLDDKWKSGFICVPVLLLGALSAAIALRLPLLILTERF